jgi:cytoskeletal protein RodZ
MSIGATLATARRRAGMTVGDVSHLTRVTEPIILGIETDDYGACGGDFYARGHIRAIARAVGEDPVPLIDEFDSTWRSAKDSTAAEAFEPGMPIRKRERRRVRGAALLGVVVLAVLGFACYKFVASAGGSHPATAAASQESVRPAGQVSERPASAPAVQATKAQASPSAAVSASPAPPPVQTLALAGVTAFGPDGAADGDHPELAAQATGGDPGQPWITHWYGTSGFAGTKDGTGLLIDMGHAETITSVKLSLGSSSGADLQLRAGSKPVPASLSRVASVTDAGSHVQFRPGSPVHARYLLVWFTKLPPDNAGTYQASVYNITVQGQR